MKKTVMVFILLALTLCSCGKVEADIPDTPEAKATQVLVEDYILAYQTYDIDRCVSLFSDEATYADVGSNFEITGKGLINDALHEEIVPETFKTVFRSYLVTGDGHFAVIQAIYSHRNFSDEPWVSTPYVILLEIEDGKIIQETLYSSKIIF